ncbi:TPA: hypothetical protein ACOFB9_000722 [Stenotrophomonas maltophilia]|uniref:hypothetical protein n=1 Tax=Stenotrophomonas maltophilia TaxID=40324 RepID=UPI002ACC79D0|nr:hypothetical protein [Stenotrophomonas maltophilia]MDZ5777643.1 hypothetical protein [Stenotrophomonas maltophilia]
MAKKRVPLHQNPRGFVDVDPDATNGAMVGVNLRGPDGQILTAAQVINPTTGGSGGPGSIASTIWKLIKEIPLNIQKLAALIGAGFAVRKNDGEWALRTLQEGIGIDIANPDGDAGNPTISLEDVPDSGAGSLLAISKDSKGRVTGTRPATITGTAQQIAVANGNAAAGLPTISLADLPDNGQGALLAFQRDSKGRLAGTREATTTDLSEGTNLYYTNTRADARIAAQRGQPNGVADLDASGKIPADRLPAIDHNNLSGLQGGTTGERYHLTNAQVGEVNTSLQAVVAGSGISVNNSDPRRPVVSAVAEKSGVFIGGVELTSSFVSTTPTGTITPITGMNLSFVMPDRPVLISFGTTAFYDSSTSSNLAAVILRVNGSDAAQLFFSAAITNFWSQGKQYLLSGVAAGTTVNLSWWLNMGPGTFTVFGNPSDKPYIYVVTV